MKEVPPVSLHKKQWLCVGVMAVGIFLVLLASAASNARQGLAVLGCVVSGAGLILQVRLVRCPHCGTWVGKYPGEFCKNCGKELPWDEK